MRMRSTTALCVSTGGVANLPLRIEDQDDPYHSRKLQGCVTGIFGEDSKRDRGSEARGQDRWIGCRKRPSGSRKMQPQVLGR